MYLYNEFIINIINDMNTLLCPSKSNSKFNEPVHTSCYWSLRFPDRTNKFWYCDRTNKLQVSKVFQSGCRKMVGSYQSCVRICYLSL